MDAGLRPLDADPRPWRRLLAEEARRRGWPAAEDPAALADRVRRVSDAYNHLGRVDHLPAAVHLAARLGFFLPRDIPKLSGAAREAAALGWIPPDARVLDVGCGIGASTFGLARVVGEGIRVTAVDRDAGALELFRALAGAIRVETYHRDLGSESLPEGSFEVVLLGQVLSERPEGLLDAALERLAPAGLLVVVEPALRDRTRRLMAERDRLGARGVRVAAPCLREGPCPMLPRGRDWCHEDLPVDLPDWLVPVARAAGLRWQGLTFAYLVLRKEGETLAEAVGPGVARVVDAPRRSRGKHELSLCGPEHPAEWVRRLDRHRSPVNAPWSELTRGELVRVRPGSVVDDTGVTRVPVVSRGAP